MTENIEIFDTSLRDGSQALGVNLSLADKLSLTEALDWLGVAYIEGGWPGSNPKDEAYFCDVAKMTLETSKIVAFGSTRHFKNRPEEDGNLKQLVESQADVICIFGKAWDLHVTDALRVGLDDNLAMIADSISYLKETTGKPVFFDAEHFFDGYAANPEYALSSVEAAAKAGADRIVLCDTNGGGLPESIAKGVRAAKERLGNTGLGIHVHNDCGCAVANTLAAVAQGVVQVQGTINGVGERCGNVDLTSVIANLELKLGKKCLPEGRVERLTTISRLMWERMNMVGPLNQPYVGKAACAHKGGIHVSAMARNEKTYEHVPPDSVGNTRRILVSEYSGRSNVLAKLENRYPELKANPVVAQILTELQERENDGYSYEAADASFDLLVRKHLGNYTATFELDYYRVHGIGTAKASSDSVEATVKMVVKGKSHLCVAEGNGPVDALSHAMMQALVESFPELQDLRLIDYKVRVVNSSDGTAAKVRVLIENRIEQERFVTIGVSENIIEASFRALSESFDYVVLNLKK